MAYHELPLIDYKGFKILKINDHRYYAISEKGTKLEANSSEGIRKKIDDIIKS